MEKASPDLPPPFETCPICNCAKARRLAEFEPLWRVTSDCRPFPPGGNLYACDLCGGAFKPRTSGFSADLAALYKSYDIYYQAGGVEQMVFDPRAGTQRRRSQVLADAVVSARALKPGTRIADIGCGNGAFLRELSTRALALDLHAVELDGQHLETLSTIAGFKGLSTSIARLPEQLDVVSMIHCLEHFSDPMEPLQDIRRKLSPDGLLFLQLPDPRANPFDFVIADHLLHFTPTALRFALEKVGFSILAIGTDCIPKEITVMASPAPGEPTGVRAQGRFASPAPAHLQWLRACVERAQAIAAAGELYVFGTSIAGVWLAGALEGKITAFVDDDPARQGAELLDTPILSPELVPSGAQVYLGLAPAVAQLVFERHAKTGWRLILPPPLQEPNSELLRAVSP